jgi:hypothetical protein
MDGYGVYQKDLTTTLSGRSHGTILVGRDLPAIGRPPLEQLSRMIRPEGKSMAYPPSAMTVEQKILAALARIERKVDDMERRVKAVQQDLNRVKRIVRG